MDEAHFEHPEIAKVNRKLFQEKDRTEELTRTIDKLKRFLKNEIRRYVKEFEIDYWLPKMRGLFRLICRWVWL